MRGNRTLEQSWMESGLGKIRSRFSNVLFFETEDPERYTQFLRGVQNIKDFKEHALFYYDRWMGLKRYDRKNEQFIELQAGEQDRYATKTAEKTGIDRRILDIETALRRMDKELKNSKAVFLLKDMEATQESDPNHDPLLVSALRSWSQDPDVSYFGSAVIVFCSKVELLVDSYTKQRSAVIPVDLSEVEERACVIEQAASDLNISLTRGTAHGGGIEHLARLTAGLNLHQLHSVLLECLAKSGDFNSAILSRLKSDWIKREEVVEIVEPKGGFGTIGGYEVVKDFVKSAVVKVLTDTEGAKRLGVPLPRGILLFGPPGTGKTIFAKALAGETNLPFINLKTENLISQWLGQSGRLFSRAISICEKNAPAIVFIDEIDRFGKRHGTSGDSAGEETRRVFNQILEWLGDEARKSIIVGTTNRPNDLDDAMLRAGRLDYKIPFPYPNEEARRQILGIHLGLTGIYLKPPERPAGVIEEGINWLIGRTQNFAGAELQELVKRIRRSAFSRGSKFVEATDFEYAANNFTIDREVRERIVREHLEHAKEFSSEKLSLDS